MCRKYLVLVLVSGLVCGQNLPNDNICSYEGSGKCKPFFECPVAIQQVKQQEFHKLVRCGFSGLTELVCCPETIEITRTNIPEDVPVTKKPAEVEVTEASTKPYNSSLLTSVTVTKRPAEVVSEITEANTKFDDKFNVTKLPSEVAPNIDPFDDVCNVKGIGKCKSFFKCPVAMEQANQYEFHKLTRCGFSGLIELVCCPESNDVTTARHDDDDKVTVTKRAATEVVPIGSACSAQGNGTCIPFNECPVAMDDTGGLFTEKLRKIMDIGALTESKQVKQNEFHKLTRCGFSGLVELVCCPETTVSEGFLVDDKFADDKRPAELECDNIIKSFPPPTGSYIIGGVNASLGEFPHMVAIGFIKKGGTKISFICGGSLISSRYVLTAAHCHVNAHWKSPDLRIRIGVIDKTTSNYDSEYNVTEIRTHPDYIPRSRYNDLSLFKLDREVPFDLNRHPICLYTLNDLPKTEVVVTGWGKTDIAEENLSNFLLKAKLTIMQISECSNFFQPQRTLENGITDKLICASDPDNVKDSCQGDSGGPLQALTSSDGHFRLIGVTAFGKSCGGTTPGVYTNVQKNLDWIETVVWPQYFVSDSKDQMFRINL